MASAPPVAAPSVAMRVDKWLWQARFFKSRSVAAELILAGRLRLNAVRLTKPAHPVRPQDVLTFPQAGRVRVIRVLALGVRRGPAQEARGLYQDLEPPLAGAVPPPPEAADRGTPNHRSCFAPIRRPPT